MDLVYTIATCLIAVFMGVNVWFVKKIKSRDDEFRDQLMDFYKGIIVSNVMGRSPGFTEEDLSDFVYNFNILYEKAGGKAKIFEN